ncbi:hypothetical protein BTR14_02105 [Rhizobium rhizosphaerae]|uniref:Hedgehog/Intein (Hint) domain-containing protein n=1 Tax=Xaviernesmea rhizosphaerae TaxID=1672749 RepID=A0ABX3PJK2_9HYPH|nr:hypothetical protein BTR14_02105 [Xaviernesmea rhizosphaerae]
MQFVPTRKLVRLTDVTDGTARMMEGAWVEPLAFAPLAISHSLGKVPVRTRHLEAKAVFIDGPLLQDGDRDHAAYVGGVMLPLRKEIALYRTLGESGFVLDGVLTLAATMGVTTAPLHAGPLWRWDRGNSLSVRACARHAGLSFGRGRLRRRECPARRESGWRMGIAAIRRCHARSCTGRRARDRCEHRAEPDRHRTGR